LVKGLQHVPGSEWVRPGGFDMERLSGLVLRHRLLVVLAWLALTVAGGLTVGTMQSRLALTVPLPDEPGFVASARIAALYHTGGPDAPAVIVVRLPPGLTAGSPGVRAELGQLFGRVRPAGYRVVSYASTGDAAFTAAGGRVAYALVFTAPVTSSAAPSAAARISALLADAAPRGWQVGVTGLPALSAAGASAGSGLSLAAEIIVGGVGALVVLAWVYASFLAIVPLLMAIPVVMTAFVAILAITYATPVVFFMEYIVGLIGLGIAIDYSLLVITRWREERARGADNRAAVQAAMATAGRAVAFSGVVVTIGLAAMAVLPVPFLRTVGLVCALIPLLSVAVAVTLLPVLLGTIGPRLDWPHRRTGTTAGRAWIGWARGVIRLRWAAAIAGLAMLAVIAAPARHLVIGDAPARSLARAGPAHATLATLTGAGVPTGVLTPVEVLTTPAAAPAVARSLSRLPGVVTAVAPGDHAAGTALVDVLPVTEPSDAAGQATIAAIRTAVAGNRGVLGVGGYGTVMVDFRSAVYGSFPLLLTVILACSFLLLTRVFRSPLLALKAVLLNLLAVGAVYGAVVFIWQEGHATSTLWGLPGTGAVTTWVPLFTFAFLFGLSMDYEVFLISRMREAHDRGATTDQAVIEGLSRTGRLITSAALIMFLTQVSLSTIPFTDVKVFATGMGIGILLDATVVRCLLVPALVSLLGRWNWWLPAPLARLMRLPPAAAGDPGIAMPPATNRAAT
jgi:RND superfamily putative drug exporter